MNKKILLSVAASALLTTSAFAGTISTDSGHAKITQESYEQNGMDVINFSSFKYVADINNNGSLSISDPLVRIDISDIEMPIVGGAVSSGDNTARLFNANGRGYLMGSAAVNVVPLDDPQADDQINELETIFGDTYLVDIDANGNPTGTYLEFNQVNAEANTIYLNFTGTSADSIVNGHTYVLSKSATQIDEVDIDFKYVKGNQKMSLKTYSQTLDTNLQDEAEFANTTEFPPQFKVNCVRKFDGLINFENDRVTFVNPEHGDRIEVATTLTRAEDDGSANGVNIMSDSVIDRDRMIFTVLNNRDGSLDTRYMGGHGTEFMFDVDNNYNLFPAATGTEWDYNLKILPAEQTNLDNNGTYTDTLLAGVPALTGVVTFAANKFTITHPVDKPIPAGLTAYQLDLVSLSGATPIRPVEFTDASVDLEGGLVDNILDTEDTASRTEVNGDAVLNAGVQVPEGDVANNYITNSPDESGTGTEDSADDGIEGVAGDAIARAGAAGRGDNPAVTIAPGIESDTNMAIVGEWRDHAYMAQIAGASSTQAGMSTKLFIVNRSCVTVTPEIEIIKDGVKVPLTGVASIDPDNQGFYDIGALLEAMTPGATAGSDYARYAIEVTLGGVAEDFYMYAQVKNSTINQFKDLPVYNTSSRD